MFIFTSECGTKTPIFGGCNALFSLTLDHIYFVYKRLHYLSLNHWGWMNSTVSNEIFSIDNTEVQLHPFLCMRQIVDELSQKHGRFLPITSRKHEHCYRYCCVCWAQSRKIVDYNAFRFIIYTRCLQCTYMLWLQSIDFLSLLCSYLRSYRLDKYEITK